MKLKKTILYIAVLGFFSAMSGAANADSMSKNAYRQQTLKIGIGASISALDPAITSDVSSQRVLNDIYEGLVKLNQKDEIIPGVAKSWEVSKDGKTYTFYLRDDAKWSNGEPVTAADFVFGFQRNLDPSVPNVFNTMFKAIQNAPAIISRKEKDFSKLGVKAVDAHTLQITLTHPQTYFLQLLLIGTAYPLYKPAIDKYGKSWAQPGKIVTNGPYIVKDWVPNGHIKTVKNPHYWNKKAVSIETIKYFPIVDLSTEYAKFRSGDLDMTWSVPAGKNIEYFEKKYGNQLQHNTMLGNEYFWFNYKNKDFAKLDVRKALTIVVDRKALVTHVMKQGETPSYSVLPDGVQGGIYKDIYKTMPSYNWVNQDNTVRQKEAIALLKKAGYSKENPLTFTVTYDTSPWKKRLTLAVVGMWQNAFGDMIKVSLKNQEWKVFLKTMEHHEFDVGLLDWKADYNDASDWVELITCGSSNNYGGSCNQEVTNYFKLAIKQPSKKEAIPYMKKAIIAGMKDYMILPLYNYSYNHLMSKRIEGFSAKYNHMNSLQSMWLSFKDSQPKK